LRGAGFGGLLVRGQHLGPGLALRVVRGLFGGDLGIGSGAGLLDLLSRPCFALGQAGKR
jgi:hypothetical protein